MQVFSLLQLHLSIFFTANGMRFHQILTQTAIKPCKTEVLPFLMFPSVS